MGHPLHHLELIIRSCRADLRLNGFPIISLTAPDETPVTFAPPVNPFLAGERNVIDLTLTPAKTPDGKDAPFAAAHAEFSVRKFEKGGIVEPGGGDVVTSFTLPDPMRAQISSGALGPPVIVPHVFKNEVIDFSAEFFDEPAFDDPDAVVAYGVRLRDLAAARDEGALLTEFDPKIQTWATAYDEPVPVFVRSLRSSIGDFFAAKPETKFEPHDIDVRPWCGGRIWEVSRKDGAPLLRSEEDAEGARLQFPVFAAMRKGALRIVR